MLFGMFLMFILLMAGEGIVVWFAWRRLADYLKDNPEACAALATHLFVPLFGRKPAPEKTESPEPQKVPEAFKD